jgi:hypothetical protein
VNGETAGREAILLVGRHHRPVERAERGVVRVAAKQVHVADERQLRRHVGVEPREVAHPPAALGLVRRPAPDFGHLVAELRAFLEEQPVLDERPAEADPRPERFEANRMPGLAARRPEADVRRVERDAPLVAALLGVDHRQARRKTAELDRVWVGHHVDGVDGVRGNPEQGRAGRGIGLRGHADLQSALIGAAALDADTAGTVDDAGQQFQRRQHAVVAHGQLFDDAALEHALRAQTLTHCRRRRLGIADHVDLFGQARQPQVQRRLRRLLGFDFDGRSCFLETAERRGDMICARCEAGNTDETLTVRDFNRDGVVVERRQANAGAGKDDRSVFGRDRDHDRVLALLAARRRGQQASHAGKQHG